MTIAPAFKSPSFYFITAPEHRSAGAGTSGGPERGHEALAAGEKVGLHGKSRVYRARDALRPQPSTAGLGTRLPQVRGMQCVTRKNMMSIV